MSGGRHRSLRLCAIPPYFKIINGFLKVNAVHFLVKLDKNPLNIGQIGFLVQNLIVFGFVDFPVKGLCHTLFTSFVGHLFFKLLNTVTKRCLVDVTNVLA